MGLDLWTAGGHLGAMNPSPPFAVAPMMDRTDRHCRFFHRQLSRKTLLFTEMVAADAVIHGDRRALLAFDQAEHPIALQLGGSDPFRLAEAARIGATWGYDEINLNVGCPSDRVQSGKFGACLMLDLDLVARCVEAIRQAVGIRVTVKCRLGVDDQDVETALDQFVDGLISAGADGVWVHARKAWLQGLSPKQNRTVPPLDYDRVYRLKRRLPGFFVGINGGVQSVAETQKHLADVDGVMVGRSAYDRPAILAGADRALFGSSSGPTADTVIDAMVSYANRQISDGVSVGRVTRPMLGLFHGLPGARAWRRALTEGAAGRSNNANVIREAYAIVSDDRLLLEAAGRAPLAA